MNKTYYKLNELTTSSLSDREQEKGKWQALKYRAQSVDGIALCAGVLNNPNAVELDLNVSGWHKVYFGLASVGYNPTGAVVSISNEDGKTFISKGNTDKFDNQFLWSGAEHGEEVFYKATDLTGKKIIIEKPVDVFCEWSTLVLFVRIEEMTAQEVEQYLNQKQEKRIMWHFDNDYYFECDYEKPEDYLGRINRIEYGNGEILVHELFQDAYVDDFNEKPYYRNFRNQLKCYRNYADNSKKVLSLIKERAKQFGMEIYGGYRVEVADNVYPSNPSSFMHNKIIDNAFTYRCLTREGNPVDILSFSYPEVRKYAVDRIISSLPDDWDGVSVFMHRGLYVGIDLPVIEEVKKRYGVDARRLPRSDERLHTVMCEFITMFFRELKERLELKSKKANRSTYKINVVALYDIESSKYFGCDIETLVKEKLVDSVSQGLMGHYEAIDDCLAEDGLIDLEKYKAKKENHYVITRKYGDIASLVLGGLKGFLDIQKKYGGEFYAAMNGWTNYGNIELAKQIYEAGAEKLFVWNTNHLVKNCTTAQELKLIGNKDKITNQEIEIPRKVFRIVSYNGTDLSEFNPNWLG